MTKTRLAAVALIGAALGSAGTALAASPLFTDVDTDHPQADEIAQANAERWMLGYSDGTFRPDAPLTERQFGKVLSRVFDDLECPTAECEGITRAEAAAFVVAGAEIVRTQRDSAPSPPPSIGTPVDDNPPPASTEPPNYCDTIHWSYAIGYQNGRTYDKCYTVHVTLYAPSAGFYVLEREVDGTTSRTQPDYVRKGGVMPVSPETDGEPPEVVVVHFCEGGGACEWQRAQVIFHKYLP